MPNWVWFVLLGLCLGATITTVFLFMYAAKYLGKEWDG